MTNFAHLFVLAFGVFLMSAALLYGTWPHIRLLFVRDELFRIRDKLWKQVAMKRAFDDVAYRECRRHINAQIQLAGMMNVPVLRAMVVRIEPSAVAAEQPKSTDPELQEMIDRAYSEAAECMINFMFFRHASGIFCLVTLAAKSVFEMSFNGFRQTIQSLRTFLSSPMPEQWQKLDKTSDDTVVMKDVFSIEYLKSLFQRPATTGR